MGILCFRQKLGMDINQIMELWRGLSPHLTGAIHGQELPRGERTDEKKRNEGGKDKTVDPIESHHEEDDV
jgi:hypothetical protein